MSACILHKLMDADVALRASQDVLPDDAYMAYSN